MTINRIEIQGFRNIDKVHLELNQCTALVSLNNYGKSNVLEAIKFGLQYIKNPDMLLNFTDIPMNKKILNLDYTFTIEFETLFNNNKHLVEYSFGLCWGKFGESEGTSFVSMENLKFKEKEATKYYTYFSRKEALAKYQSSPSGRNDKKIPIGKRELVLNKLYAHDELFYIDIIKDVKRLNFDYKNAVNISYIFEPRLDTKIESENDFSNVNNVPKTIAFIKQKYPNKFKLIINIFKDFFPNFTDIICGDLTSAAKNMENITDNRSMYYLFAVDNNLENGVFFDMLSLGAKRIFLYITYIILAQINKVNIIAIEELENSIHPGLFNRFINMLYQLSTDDFKIIITSHSPYIIQYMDLENIYIGEPNEFGIAGFRRFKKSAVSKIYELADMYGISTGDFIFEQLSGSTDEIDRLVSFLR